MDDKMRRTKVVIVLDVEIDEQTESQDLADVCSQALRTVDETIIHDLILYEHEPDEETFSSMLDEIRFDFQYGQCRNW